MAKIYMIYASQTGCTEQITDILEDYLKQLGHDVLVRSFDFDVIDVAEIEAYDAVVIGTYTWDDGELPYEVEDFYIDIEDYDMKDYVAAVYGSADSFYDTYGGAIDLVYNHVKSLGATMVDDAFKVDLDPDAEDEKRLMTYAVNISKAIEAKQQAAV